MSLECKRLQIMLKQRQQEVDALREGFQSSAVTHDKQLQHAQARNKRLRDEIHVQEQFIDELRKHAMAQLASDNSSSFPDDKVERSFRNLLSGDDFDYWVDDNMAKQITDPKAAVQTLQQSNVMVPSDLEAAFQLKSMESSHKLYIKALVEGALVGDFCRRFLSNPFFQRPELFSDSIQKMANSM